MTTLTAEANFSRRKLMASNKHGPPGKPPTTWPGAGIRPQPRALIKNKAPVLVYQNEPLLGFVPPKKLRRKKNDTKPVPQPVLTDWNGIEMGMACIFITDRSIDAVRLEEYDLSVCGTPESVKHIERPDSVNRYEKTIK